MLTTLALAATMARIRRPDAEVPMFNGGSAYTINVKIFDKLLVFAVDTGSDEVRLQPHAAERLGMIQGPKEAIYKLRWSVDSDLEIGGLTFRKVPIQVIPMFLDKSGEPKDNPNFDGVLGLDFLRRHAWGLDTLNNRLALWRGGRVDAASVAAWAQKEPEMAPPQSTPLIPTKATPHWYLMNVGLGAKRGRLILDTGSSAVVIRADRHEVYEGAGGFPITLVGLEGSAPGELGTLRPIQLPWRTLPLPVGFLVRPNDENGLSEAFAGKGADGIIGLNAFDYARSVFDFPAKRVSVSVNTVKPLLVDTMGIFGWTYVYVNEDVVAIVRPREAADRSGLKTGDVVKSVEGVPINRSNPGSVAPPGWKPGATLTVEIVRDGAPMTLTLRK